MRLREIQRQRPKIQFYVSDDVWCSYQKNRKLAKTLGVSIDYGDDFTQWFERLNTKLAEELKQLQRKRGITIAAGTEGGAENG